MSNGDESLCEIGDGGHHEFKSPIIWLGHVRPLIFQESQDARFQMGAMHAIDWSSLMDFLPQVVKLTCQVCALKENDLIVTPAFHYEQGRRVAKPGVGIFPNDGVIVSEETERELDAAFTCFAHSILKRQEIAGQDQIFPVEISERSAASVAAVVNDFLINSGGKKVGEPRMLRTMGCEILVSGTYRTKNEKALPEPKRKVVLAEIDGMRGMIRTIFLNIGDRKTITLLFDEARFKEELRSRVLDGLVYEFVIDTEWIAIDKTVDTLVSFSPCSDEPVLR